MLKLILIKIKIIIMYPKKKYNLFIFYVSDELKIKWVCLCNFTLLLLNANIYD